jgi:hypothetical protein
VTLIVPPALQTRKPNAALSAFPFFGGLMAPLRAWNGYAILQQAVLADEPAVKGGRPGGRALQRIPGPGWADELSPKALAKGAYLEAAYCKCIKGL